MKVLLLVVLSILGLDLLMLTIVAISGALRSAAGRWRRWTEIRALERLWRLENQRVTQGAESSARSPSLRRLARPVAPGGTFASLDSPGVPERQPVGRPRGKRMISIAVVAVFVCAGTAIASPQARNAFTSTVATIGRLIGLGPDETKDREQAAQGPYEGAEPLPSETDLTPRTGLSRLATGHDVSSRPAELGPSGAGPLLSTNAAGDSAPSGVVSATTAIDPPSAPSVTIASSSSSEIDLSWNDVATETGYRVERSSDGATGWTPVATLRENVTGYSDTGLPAGTTYYYRVFATNTAGDSAPSGVVSATTSP